MLAEANGVSNARAEVSVLVVDDTELWRGLATSVLEHYGYSVSGVSSNGVEALERIHECRPDVVLMDIDMPRLDGVDATRLIARLYPGVRVIGLSSHTERVYVDRMLDAGAVAYVRKDQLIEKLTDTIDALGLTA